MKNNTKTKNFFIVLEGPDGVGKSTLIKLLEQKLEKDNFPIKITQEPQKNFPLREKLLISSMKLSPLTETLMFILDRHMHWNSLENWKKNQRSTRTITLCDRYFYSTFVYQGLLGKIPFNQLKILHKNSGTWNIPDLVFFLDVHNSQLLQTRIKQKQLYHDRFHDKINGKIPDLIKYYHEVMDYFRKENPPHPIVLIDCSKSIEKVVEEMYQKIMKMISTHELSNS